MDRRVAVAQEWCQTILWMYVMPSNSRGKVIEI